MVIIELILFCVACGVARRILPTLVGVIIAVIAANYWFSGGTEYIAYGMSSAILLGESVTQNQAESSMFHRQYGRLFDMIGTIMVIIGIIKVIF